jgi:hypothetical protein
MKKQIKAAILQAAPVPLDITYGIERLIEFVADAADIGAEVAAFGETFLGGYPLWLGEELDANLKVLDEAGLPAYLFWVRVDLNKPLDPQVLSALGKLKGHPATISGNPGPRRVVNAGALHTVNLIDAILGKNKTVTTLASAIRSDISCHLVDLAIRHGGKVGWDAAANTITGNEPAKLAMRRPMREPWNVLNPKYTS